MENVTHIYIVNIKKELINIYNIENSKISTIQIKNQKIYIYNSQMKIYKIKKNIELIIQDLNYIL